MTPQSAFMISAEIVEQRLGELRALLRAMNLEPGVVNPENTLVPFSEFERLHFARFLIIDARNQEDIKQYGLESLPWVPTLYFLGDCDGPYETFLEELAANAAPGLQKIFSHCHNFDDDHLPLGQWLIKHNISPAANYINWIGRTVLQVKQEAALHQRLRAHLTDIEAGAVDYSPEQLHRSLRELAEDEIGRNELTLSAESPTPTSWWIANLIHKIGVPIVLLLLSPLFLIILVPAGVYLRYLERSDPEITPRPDPALIADLSESEDRLVTNQFSAFGEVKPGFFRRWLIVFFLFMLNYASRHIFNSGFLTRVRTIHFARWVLLDDKRRVLFASNYDGDLESYMDDFINKVGWGLNLVFSNGVGWPRTRWLVKEGAEHEQKFKYFLRRHQYHTDVWYKAYPDLNAVDLDRNTRIRRGLFSDSFRSQRALQEWLDMI